MSRAASLFSTTESELDYLKEFGLNPDDLAGSFEQLCSTEAIFCHPVKELVIMGYDWDYMSYLVRLSSPDGETFTSPKGAQIITLYVLPDEGGTPQIAYLPMD